MAVRHDQANLRQFLTPQESAELQRIRQDPSVVGLALLSFDGLEIESSGIFKDLVGPIFANIFDIADQMGEEFGATDTCPLLMLESPDFEIAGITLSSAKAVIVKRKQHSAVEGLRLVG